MIHEIATVGQILMFVGQILILVMPVVKSNVLICLLSQIPQMLAAQIPTFGWQIAVLVIKSALLAVKSHDWCFVGWLHVLNLRGKFNQIHIFNL